MYGGGPARYRYPVWSKWWLQDTSCSLRFLSQDRLCNLDCLIAMEYCKHTGVTTLGMLNDPTNEIQPDFYTNQISDLLAKKVKA